MDDCNFHHECEEFEDNNGEGDNWMKFQACEKNTGHPNFIPVCDLKMEDVPPQFQTGEWMRFIREHCNRTVKLRLSYTSEDRPDTWFEDVPYPSCHYKGNKRIARCGTGYIGYINVCENGPCQCNECKNSTHPVKGYKKVWVWTARHVIFDDSEAVQTTVECFFDRPDKKGITLLNGSDSYWDSLFGTDNDIIILYCYTHDKDVMEKLNERIGKRSVIPRFSDGSLLNPGFTVSHPHGVHKQISFGHPLFIAHSIRKNRYPKHPGFIKCRLKDPFCTHNTPISQCQERIKDEEESKMYLVNVTCSSMVEPDIEYLLPDTSKICLPYHQGILRDWMHEDSWFEIPQDCGYTDSSGKLVHFPPGMEIRCELEYLFTHIYDIPTCPGSSGAQIFTTKYSSDIFYGNCVHTGADKVLGNKGFIAH